MPLLWVALLSVVSKSGWNGMECLGFLGFPLGLTLSLIYRDRLGPWLFRGCVYGLHEPESRRVLQRCSVDYGVVVEPKKPWVSSSCSILTLCMSGCVGLERPPLGGPSGVFLVAKEVGSHVGSGAAKPLEVEGNLSSCVTPRV